MRPAIVGVAVLSVACSLPVGGPEQAQPVAVPPTVPEATMRSIARSVLVSVNEARRTHGAAPLVADAALNSAARDHADELARRERLDHASVIPERRTMAMRIEAAGATWQQAAENLVSTGGAASEVPDRVVDLWMNSEGHRHNMLSTAYTHTGVGVSIDRRGVWYITQLYVLPGPDR